LSDGGPAGGAAAGAPPASPFVSVVLPIHDQADHLQRILVEYLDAFAARNVRHELILVLNGCSDDSPAIAAELERRHPAIRTIVSSRSGWGHAVKLGIAAARGDLVAYTNSARTSGDDLVQAVRFAVNNPGVIIKVNRRMREGAIRRAGSLLYNLQCRVLFQLASWDVNGTPKVFPRTCSRLLELTSEDDLIDLEFNVLAREAGYPMLEMPIFSYARHGGRSTTTFRGALRIYWGALRYWRARGGERR
jgi:glycosyltransferase involved in cell wall biosynthesis